MKTKTKMLGIALSEKNVPKVMSGEKTQTRRIIRNAHFFGSGGKDGDDWNDPECWGFQTEDVEFLPLLRTTKEGYYYSGRYRVGDRLYIKEALEKFVDHYGNEMATYKTDGQRVMQSWMRLWRSWHSDAGKPWKNKIIPARYIPRSAARTFIEITDVRCERIQEVSEGDCQAEGVILGRGDLNDAGEEVLASRYEQFQNLWNDTNGKGAWERNDWVFAYDFKVLTNG